MKTESIAPQIANFGFLYQILDITTSAGPRRNFEKKKATRQRIKVKCLSADTLPTQQLTS